MTLVDEKIGRPVWRIDVKSQKDADNSALNLMVCLWNADDENGTCSISINTKFVEKTLENLMPRSHPAFGCTRDEIILVLYHSSVAMVSRKVNSTGLSFMGLFGSEQ